MERFLRLMVSVAIAAALVPVGWAPAAFGQEASAVSDSVGTGDDACSVSDLLAAGEYVEGRVIARVSADFALPATYSTSAPSCSDLYAFASPAEASGSKSRAGSSGEEPDRAVLIESSELSTEDLLSQLVDAPGVVAAQPDYVTRVEEPTVASGQTPASQTLGAPANDNAVQTQSEEAPLTNDPYVDLQWHLQDSDENMVATNAKAGWQAAENANPDWQSQKKVIAVIDTGVDYTNEDLEGSMWSNPGISELGPDGSCGYDAVDDDYDPYPSFGDSHGTHIAGIIAAGSDNGIGVSGVAPNVQIMALRVDDQNYGYLASNIARTMEYLRLACEKGVPVVAANASWGAQAVNYVLNGMIDDLYQTYGVLFVCASGNESLNADTVSMIPNNVISEGTIVVNASTREGELTDFSNYGLKSTDIAAPGSEILSTVIKGTGELYDLFDEESWSVQDNFDDGSLSEDDRLFNFTPSSVEPSAATESLSLSADAQAPRNGIAQPGKGLQWVLEGFSEGGRAAMQSESVDMGSKLEEEGTSVADISALVFDACLTDAKETNIGRYLSVFAMGTNGEWLSLGDNGRVAVYPGKFDTYRIALNEDEKEQIDWTQFQIKFERTIASADLDNALTLSFDNLSLLSKDQLSSYSFYEGTSMAAPIVTGAVAVLSAAYPQDAFQTKAEYADYLKARVLGGVTRTKAVEDSSVSSGIFNFLEAQDPYPVVGSLVQDESNPAKAVVTGWFFGDQAGKVMVASCLANVTSWSDMRVEVELPSGMSGESAYVQVVRSEGDAQWGKRWLPVAATSPGVDGGSDAQTTFEVLSAPDLAALDVVLPEYQIWPWQVESAAGRLFATAGGMQRAESRASGERLSCVISYDPETQAWSRAAGLEALPYADYRLCAQGNTIYLLAVTPGVGIYLFSDADVSVSLYTYDASTGTLSAPVAVDATGVDGFDELLRYSGLACDGQYLYLAGGGFVGGAAKPASVRDGVLTIDVATGTVSEGPSLGSARVLPIAEMLNGQVAVIAGLGEDGAINLASETLTQGAWTEATTMPASAMVQQSAPTASGVLPASLTVQGYKHDGEAVIISGVQTTSGEDTFLFDGQTWTPLTTGLSESKPAYAGGAVCGSAFYVLGANGFDTTQSGVNGLTFQKLNLEQTGVGPTPVPTTDTPSEAQAPTALAETGDNRASAIGAIALGIALSGALVFAAKRRRCRSFR